MNYYAQYSCDLHVHVSTVVFALRPLYSVLIPDVHIGIKVRFYIH